MLNLILRSTFGIIRGKSNPRTLFAAVLNVRSARSERINYSVNKSDLDLLKMSQVGGKSPWQQQPSYHPDQERIIWVDLEMTGLDVDTCHILEMACLITDENLNVIAESPTLIIHQSDEILDSMNDWCKKHHGESGLVDECKNSTVSLQAAEMQMLSFVRQHTPPGKCPLGGNSVSEDKRFLLKYMPSFTEHLHYRIIDVSTIKELCRRWYPKLFEQCPAKRWRHRALDDIKESIHELKFYRRHIFIS